MRVCYGKQTWVFGVFLPYTCVIDMYEEKKRATSSLIHNYDIWCSEFRTGWVVAI